MIKRCSRLVLAENSDSSDDNTSSATDDWSNSDEEKNLKWFLENKEIIDSDLERLIENGLLTKTSGLNYGKDFINILCKKNIVLSDNKITLLSQKLKIEESFIRKILSDCSY